MLMSVELLTNIYFLCLQASSLSYLFAGIPIFTALRFIITINTISNNEEMAPTKKIALNAVSFGTVVVVVFVVVPHHQQS